jgi:hypothetical protein
MNSDILVFYINTDEVCGEKKLRESLNARKAEGVARETKRHVVKSLRPK